MGASNAKMSTSSQLKGRVMEYVHTCYRVLRSEEHTSELQSRQYLVCRLLLEKKKKTHNSISPLHISSPMRSPASDVPSTAPPLSPRSRTLVLRFTHIDDRAIVRPRSPDPSLL